MTTQPQSSTPGPSFEYNSETAPGFSSVNQPEYGGASQGEYGWANQTTFNSGFATPVPGGHYLPPYLTGGDIPKPKRSVASQVILGVLQTVLVVAAVVGISLWFFSPRTSTSTTQTQTSQPTITIPYSPGNAQVSTHDVTVTDQMSQGVVFVIGDTQSGRSSGTGIVVQPGIILTNYHVVKSTTDLYVQFEQDGDAYSAEMLGYSSSNDVAVLKVDNPPTQETAKIATSTPQIDDDLIAVGNARGGGVLYGTGGKLISTGETVDIDSSYGAESSETLTGMLKSSLGAVPGYSGGPTFNSNIEVVGITTAGSENQTSQMQSYSIPIDRAIDIMNQVLSGTGSDDVRIGRAAWIGISMNPHTGEITSISSGSPAEQAGIRPGEAITAVDGIQLDSPDGLTDALLNYSPGDNVELTLSTSVSQRSVNLTLGESPTN